MRSESLPAVDLEYFLAIPWCAKHLRDDGVETLMPPGRIPQASMEDEVWFKTLNTPETFSHFLAFHPRTASTTQRLDEVGGFVTVNHGVQGFPGVVQGGITTTLLDGIAGLIPGLNRQRGVFPRVPFVTAYLNTTFYRPVHAPSTLLLRARTTKIDGRKLFVEASIHDKVDKLLAKADVLFVESQSRL
ncbi:hypothetical protein GQ53DRAFT_819477 [Thozetella sp. PMI_491]|nr:hypothetical protein GQ53DRAFT_819477 [Thozetella sp. PMI_491]